ncbi:ABC transporter ATP-binding protein [Mangrovibacter phragmitis]|jgi:ABC-type branched-subunit amino acid transport system ATPase component|uniref:ABC transporter ATP-binding protein n=1 Tax=Mangrovibacter phragmitis TaxID=1691903 RepID=A0A1B7L077_9ENTR|nr:ATP-binding cassette domain-containing protein [Mangrovibacter phragmitis]OAT75668.1 ABC transporter ATP-binding protein [Mangrovibacter phragmitis]
MLSLRAVNQFYGEKHTLWNVDLDLPTGQCICLLGAPGVGKTTLVNCITGHIPVQSGSMLWQAQGCPPEDLLTRPPEGRTALGIGYVPQDKRIFSQLSVEENLHIAMMAAGEQHKRISPLVYELFPELYTLRQVRGGDLAGDTQQQLALARALVNDPKLLILDEPTNGRGTSFIQDLGQTLRRLNQEFGLTILLVEQRLSFIRWVADKFCLLHRGRNVAQGDLTMLDDNMVSDWIAP